MARLCSAKVQRGLEQQRVQAAALTALEQLPQKRRKQRAPGAHIYCRDQSEGHGCQIDHRRYDAALVKHALQLLERPHQEHGAATHTRLVSAAAVTSVLPLQGHEQRAHLAIISRLENVYSTANLVGLKKNQVDCGVAGK